MKEKGAIWKLDANDADVPLNGTNGKSNGANGTNCTNGIKSGVYPTPSINDIIGQSLKFVGAYKNLDNKKQVVALIDDVIIHIILFFR